MNAESLALPNVTDTARSLDSGIALYVHIPFCETKCPYCDFNTYAGINHLLPPYLAALEREVHVWSEVLGHPTVNTVFLGGGTPSMLSPAQMASLLSTARAAFPVAPAAEVTAEVNPDDATVERLSAFREAGVNRISLGVQSLDDAELRMLGRRHGAAEALEALAAIQRAGFDNFSADLMYGLPHQGMATWQRTVEGVIASGPQHVSAYALTMEEGTPFGKQAADGVLPEQDADLAAEMYWWADGTFAAAGLRNYEISNWARPGMESRHNVAYWRNVPYLGVGPGAHSFIGGYRFANMKSPVVYMT
ncbi:MAG: radical SAM family heme chaperone HemW, partial [Chloroflexota bacterium]|nr:radical SAM family heme chaperone HemW [Chloroflexota bacterium]